MSDTPPSLLIRLRDADDHRSWQRFFEQYWRLIYSFARKCGLPSRDCEDILQEVITEVFRAMPRFNYDRSRGTFRAYLRTITVTVHGFSVQFWSRITSTPDDGVHGGTGRMHER